AYRRAREERDSARGRLPETLAEAGAEQLAALEHRLREDLGGLESARRAEQRAGQIADERAALDRQARADEELVRDTEDWLAGWESTRQDLQTRLDAALEAATRTELLARRLDPARRRLDAARRRDALA
ncbi:SMC family ATPase, partial [Streptomyces sp. SID2563]|nr:SMC family ATPase [Streptomyces sp. SID2563]